LKANIKLYSKIKKEDYSLINTEEIQEDNFAKRKLLLYLDNVNFVVNGHLDSEEKAKLD
jgi:hypothetical protein